MTQTTFIEVAVGYKDNVQGTGMSWRYMSCRTTVPDRKKGIIHLLTHVSLRLAVSRIENAQAHNLEPTQKRPQQMICYSDWIIWIHRWLDFMKQFYEPTYFLISLNGYLLEHITCH